MNRKLLLAVLTLSLSAGAWAKGISIDGINYVLNSNNNTASVTFMGGVYSSGNTYSGNIEIPPSVNYDNTDYTVTSIGEHAFYKCLNLTGISIPSTVTSIGYSAFYGCSKLASIDIPNSVNEIADYVFQGCYNLPSIELPSTITKIGIYTFCNCWALTSIEIPNAVTSIGASAFNGCLGLKSVTMPDNLAKIGDNAFYYCSGLESITIPTLVTSVGKSAFYGCSKLESVTINSNAVVSKTYTSKSALKEIFGTQVKEYVLGDEVEGIGSYAFNGYGNLEKINIPNSITKIGNYALLGCSNLTSISIPENVGEIGDGAFADCTALADIYALRTNPAEYNCVKGSEDTWNTFRNVSASECTLHVPDDCKESYASTEPWSYFVNIVDSREPSSIGITPSDNCTAKAAGYFNAKGQRISQPQNGVNIIRRTDGTSRKVLVK